MGIVIVPNMQELKACIVIADEFPQFTENKNPR
jgi:hypothetical protein